MSIFLLCSRCDGFDARRNIENFFQYGKRQHVYVEFELWCFAGKCMAAEHFAVYF